MFLSLISALLLATMSAFFLSFSNQLSYQSSSSTLLDQSKELNGDGNFVGQKPTQAEIKKNKKTIASINPQLEISINNFKDLPVNTSKQVSSQAITFSGWLSETNGVEVADTVVKLSSPYRNLYYSTTSDEHGAFLFKGIKAGDHYQMSIENHKSYKPLHIEKISITNDTLPLQIVLEPLKLIPLQGIVVDSYGGYVPKLKLKVRSLVNSLYDTGITTDNFGRFELSEFPVGGVSFSTQSPVFFEVEGIQLSTLNGYGIVVPVNIGMQQISGWVRDQNGLPVATARIILDAESQTNGLTNHSVRTIKTDESGYFQFKNLHLGEHYITVHAKGFLSQELSYDTGTRFDQIYFQLFPGNESQITSETLKLKYSQSGHDL